MIARGGRQSQPISTLTSDPKSWTERLRKITPAPTNTGTIPNTLTPFSAFIAPSSSLASLSSPKPPKELLSKNYFEMSRNKHIEKLLKQTGPEEEEEEFHESFDNDFFDEEFEEDGEEEEEEDGGDDQHDEPINKRK